MRIFSMFSGIGGFELGFKQIYGDDLEIVGHSEINKYANKVYDYHFPGIKNYGDAREINVNDLPDFDILCGGFPCQSFSIAGNRGGIEYDTRGTLFKEIIRIAKEKRPRILFLENVKGLLSSQQGWDFYVILDSLVQLGYSIEWEMLNSKNFGVPQNRERVFIIGYFREKGRKKIFPIGRDDKKNDESKQIRRYNIRKTHKNNRDLDKTGYTDDYRLADFRCDEGLRIKEDIINSPCLTGQAREDGTAGQILFIKNKSIRRLMPIECERLQGFPDNWTKEISDAQRYRCLGNAVTVNVIKAIVKKINK